MRAQAGPFFDFLAARLAAGEFAKARERFETYETLLLVWNRKLNLISETDLEKVWTRHFQDSLALMARPGVGAWTRAIDVGSGAGFPGLPMAIAYPQKEVVLAESIAKKCAFLEEAIAVLGLGRCRVLNHRAELLGHDPLHRERFGLAVTRAAAPPQTALELVLPFVQAGGQALFWASGAAWSPPAATRAALEALGGEREGELPYVLPGEERERKLVVVRKIRPLSERYPRRVGVPEKKPL